MDAPHTRRGRFTRRRLLIGTAVLTLLVLGSGLAVFVLETDHAPVPARLPAAPAAPSGPSGPIDGAWAVSPGKRDFVGYRVREKLGPVSAPDDAVGRTRVVHGLVHVAGEAITDARITAGLSTLKSDAPPRDGALRRDGIETDRFPNASFALARPLVLGGAQRGRVLKLQAAGRLTLHGITRALPIRVLARWNGGSIDLAGSTTFALAQFNIKIAQRLGLHIADRGTMEFQLTLRRPAAARRLPAPTPEAQRPAQDGPMATSLPVNRRALAREPVARLRTGLLVIAGPPDDLADAYLVKGDGSGLKALTHQPRDGNAATVLSAARLSPGAALLSRRLSPPQADPLPARIYRVALPSGRLTALTARGTSADTPAVSPDGARIAYARTEPPADAARLYIARADGRRARPLPLVGASDDAPAFSPDGRTIAFTCFGMDEDICVVAVDGRGARHVTHGPAYDSRPSWSGDGKRLAFSRNGHIWTVGVNGKGLRRLTRGSRVRDTAPVFSPDGRMIAFVRSDARRNRSFTGPGRAMFIRPDGRGLARLEASRLPGVRLVIWR